MTSFRCSGEAAAHDAGAHDMTACADCHRHFPGGELRVYPHGNVCDDCHDDRQDRGLDREAFGVSPREEDAETKAKKALNSRYMDAIAKAFAYGFTGFGHALRVLHARDFGLPIPAAPAPRPSFMPDPDSDAGRELAAYYDRPGYKGD